MVHGPLEGLYAWKKGKLNCGNHLKASFVNPHVKASQVPKVHPRQWDAAPIVAAAFQEVGAGGPRRGDIGATTRSPNVGQCSKTNRRIIKIQIMNDHVSFKNAFV
jgi:hypothetical protein